MVRGVYRCFILPVPSLSPRPSTSRFVNAVLIGDADLDGQFLMVSLQTVYHVSSPPSLFHPFPHDVTVLIQFRPYPTVCLFLLFLFPSQFAFEEELLSACGAVRGLLLRGPVTASMG